MGAIITADNEKWERILAQTGQNGSESYRAWCKMGAILAADGAKWERILPRMMQNGSESYRALCKEGAITTATRSHIGNTQYNNTLHTLLDDFFRDKPKRGAVALCASVDADKIGSDVHRVLSVLREEPTASRFRRQLRAFQPDALSPRVPPATLLQRATDRENPLTRRASCTPSGTSH